MASGSAMDKDTNLADIYLRYLGGKAWGGKPRRHPLLLTSLVFILPAAAHGYANRPAGALLFMLLTTASYNYHLARHVLKKPSRWEYVDAAALGVAFMLSLYLLVTSPMTTLRALGGLMGMACGQILVLGGLASETEYRDTYRYRAYHSVFHVLFGVGSALLAL